MNRVTRWALLTGVCTFSVGCVTQPTRIHVPEPLSNVTSANGAGANQDAQRTNDSARALKQAATPALPPQGGDIANAVVKDNLPPLSGESVAASVSDMPLPAFVKR